MAFLCKNGLILFGPRHLDALLMMRNQHRIFRSSAAQFLLGAIALGMVTFVFFRLHVDLASTAFAYLIVIVLVSLMGSFTASALLAFSSVASLAYFFAPPIFSLRIDDPQHLVVVVAFLLTALIVTRLIRSIRGEKAAALQAFDALRESELQWREVFEHNPVMYFMIDGTGTVLSVNGFGAAQLGYSVTDLVGQSVLNVFFEEDREFVRRKVAVCLDTVGQSHTWEIRKVRKNGSVLWVRENAKAVRRANSQTIVLVASEDITERKQTENALRQSEAYLAEAQELSGTGSFGWSIATGEIIWSNETFRIFQRDPAAKPSLEFILQRTHPEDRAAVQKTLDQASSDRKDFDHEYRLLMPDGSVKYVHAVARAVRDASGSTEFLGAVTDVTVAKEAELKLRRSEAYLAESQHLSHTSSWAWDVGRREFVYRSPEVYHLFGLDAENHALSQQPFHDHVLTEDRGRVIEVAQQAIREKAHFEVDFRIVVPDGTIKRVHSVGHPVINSDGDVIELIGTHVDVTEQHAAKETLQKAFDEIKKSEDRLRLVIDKIPTLVWRAGADGVPDFLNQPALDYTGLASDEAETGWPRAFHPDDKKSMLQKWSAIRESRMPGELEARLRRFDGEYRWFLFRAEPVRDELGNIVKWYGSSTDIEDRKRFEEALRESEQRFRDYAETASDWLWETGPDHRVTRISEHFSATGVMPSSRIDMARWDFATDAESEPEKWRLHRAMLDAHLPYRDFVYRIASGTGSAVYIRSSGKPFFDSKGNFLGYRGTGTDVTAMIRADHAEQALRNAQAELAHVTRVTMLGEMTASIAHEINQPLAAIVANAEACLRWLNRVTPDLDAARTSVEWIVDDGNRAGEVIRHVRALANKTDLEKVPLDVNDVVREVIPLVQRELTSHQVLLRTELAPALPVVFGNRVQLQQVIINLVMNGIEAMESVTDRPRELAIRSHQVDRGQLLVSVMDRGVGISPEDADRLFNAFFTTKPDGMGIGLSICRSIVEAHGGRLSASSNQGPGATFQFVLPLHREEAS